MTVLSDPIGWWTSLGRPLQHLSRGGAIAVLAALLLAMFWSSIETDEGRLANEARIASQSEGVPGDLQLYRNIRDRVASGEDYYAAALDEQRSNNYPTKPFVTVRLPTLTWISAEFSETLLVIAAYIVMIATVISWIGILAPRTNMFERAAAGFLLALGGIGQMGEAATLMHELPAGLLLTLALGIYRPHRWWPSLMVAALALAIRELALPFLLLWGAFALWQKRWTEAVAIAAVVLAFLIGLYFHAGAVMAQQLPGDAPSPGWNGMHGPQLGLVALSELTGLILVPAGFAGPIALLAMLGWIGFGGRQGLFATLWFAGFWLAVSLFARTNNIYWIIVIMPAYAAGLAFAPRAISDLVQRALGRQGKRHS
jgi:hypothetical protein